MNRLAAAQLAMERVARPQRTLVEERPDLGAAPKSLAHVPSWGRPHPVAISAVDATPFNEDFLGLNVLDAAAHEEAGDGGQGTVDIAAALAALDRGGRGWNGGMAALGVLFDSSPSQASRPFFLSRNCTLASMAPTAFVTLPPSTLQCPICNDVLVAAVEVRGRWADSLPLLFARRQ